MKSQPIDIIRKRFDREWLLIAIDRMDEATTTPLSGRLLAHSPHRAAIDRASIKYPKRALVIFSEDNFPPTPELGLEIPKILAPHRWVFHCEGG